MMNIPQKKKNIITINYKNYYSLFFCITKASGLTRDGLENIYSLIYNSTVEQIFDESCGMELKRNN